MDRVWEIVERARQWVYQDDRVLGAFVHGSAARGDVTQLSDVDLIVVAQPGRREEIWAERDQISRTLIERLEDALPHSLRRAELARSLWQTAQLYRDLMTSWATRTGATPPSSPLAPGVLDALNKLATGDGERIES